MKKATLLDRVSGVFFFTGFVTFRLQHLPVFFLTPFFNLISLSSYLVGYLLWMVSSQLYPNDLNKSDPEHFLPLNKQHLIAACVGIAAIACGLAAVFVPLAIIPSCWLLAASNVIWCSSEHNKRKHPPSYEVNFSFKQQEAYFRYTVAATSFSLLTAATTTVALIFPPTALFMLILSATAGIYIGAAGLHNWLAYAFHENEPSIINNSYKQFAKEGLVTELKITSDPTFKEQLKSIPTHPEKTPVFFKACESLKNIHTDTVSHNLEENLACMNKI